MRHSIDKTIERYGAVLTLVKQTNSGVYDTITGTFSGTEEQVYNIVGYFYTNKLGDSSEIVVGSRMIAIRATDCVVPSENDYILGFGDKVRIGVVSPILSKGKPVVYLCSVKE